MKYFLLFLITANSYAGFWCPEKPNEIRFPRPNAGCFEVPEGFDAETAAVNNGALVVDSAKLAAKNARIAAENLEKSAKTAKITACLSVLAEIDKAKDIEELKSSIKCLIELR